jgi:hypothetical protein
MNKELVVVSVLMTAALTAILSTNPIAFAQDEHERQPQKGETAGPLT